MRVRKRLNDLLLEYNFISQENLQKALEKQKEQGGQLGIIVVEQGFVKEEDIVICFSQYLHIPTIRILKYTVKPEITKIIPERVARHYSVLSLSRLGNVLSVVMSDPSNLLAIDDLKALTGYDISIVVDGAGNINKAIDRFYHIHNQKTEQNADGTDSLSNVLDGIDQHDLEVVKDQEQVDISEVIRSSEEAPIVKMIDALIAEALLKRASDVHIEPYEYKIRVRYRIDGALISAATLPKKIQNAVSARVKIMSGMDITQRHIPQDGRFKVKFQNKEVDFRVSVLPVIFGEKVVLRVLDRANLSVGLQKLGFLPQSMNAISYAVTVPYGMILITGPTGSGKSTTLYSILNQLNTPDKNIITVEEPVEYQIPGITQVQVKPDIGLTFAAGLRSFLRQNPDILMVGEIRDFETADIAVKAALTGALLLSTLHTNDAPGAITRLIDMGVEPFLIAS
ncbi:MAG: type II secretion system protein GspE, partial [Candidatus Omnitrophota bacterium]